MNDDTRINQWLHEAMGKHWHDLEISMQFSKVALWTCKTCEDAGLTASANPAYDTDLTAAFDLVEWARKERLMFFQIDSFLFSWHVKISAGTTVTVGEAEDESLPKAISLACYNALAGEEQSLKGENK